MTAQSAALRVIVRGVVQGVGFRPFVYNLAHQFHLTGWVRNTSRGVEIEVNGSEAGISSFLSGLRNSPPPLSRIDSLETYPTQLNHWLDFQIIESIPEPGDFLPVSPDMSICQDCQRELFDPSDRRYRYPFINCTNCGPRFTIIKDIPYDRPLTTMADFTLCETCAGEYHNPLDRRFHAQPVACDRCGPQVWTESSDRPDSFHDEAIQIARQCIISGKIVAVKGLGGYHLACDACNPQAVIELRRRKLRSQKAFALMAFDLTAVEKNCYVSSEERELLSSRQRPIVLLKRKPTSDVAFEIAPGQNTLGVMLAYTPLHLLLLEPGEGFPQLLVMTSANLAEEPIAYQDEDAHHRLTKLADGFLLHNRQIHMRVDDSVARIFRKIPYLLRRSRGFAPDPIRLPFEVPPILAVGGELKNTFCLTRENYAFLSHHIGDMENYETYQSMEEGIEHYQRLFRIHPKIIASDLHPDYLASRYARQRANVENLPLVEIQHHHAHLAACLADNGWTSDQPVIGVSFDGTGYGTDGAIWGSEFLLGNYSGYRRMAHLKYVPLPGGDQAVRKVSRMALAHLWSAGFDWEASLPPVEALCSEERLVLHSQLTQGINSPLTSSMGRLFDAVSALIGICQQATYEGQAAIELENLADPAETISYGFDFQADHIDPRPMWEQLLTDYHRGVSKSQLAGRFHNGLAWLVLSVCRSIRQNNKVNTVALSGGVWQNMTLLEKSMTLLEQDGFTVLIQRQVPTNDGCISLGQAVIAAKSWQLSSEKEF